MKKEYGSLVLTFVLWGSMYVANKLLLGRIPAFTLSFFRYLIAFLTLCLVPHKGAQKIDKQDYRDIAIIGFLGYFAAVALQLIGIKLAGASMASLINSLNPISISLMGAIILKEKMTPNKVVGILLSLAGVYCIIGGHGQGGMAGIVVSLFAVLGWSYMSVTSRKVSRKYAPALITRTAMLIAMVCNIPMAIGEIVITKPLVQFDAIVVVLLLYIGVLCTALTNILWNKCLSSLEANTCSAFYPVQPLTSSFFGILFFQETLTLPFLIGFVLIVAGVLISLLAKSHPKVENTLNK